MSKFFLFLLLLLSLPGFTQSEQPPFTPAEQRINSFEQRQQLTATSIVKGVEFRSIGPSVSSGRVVDVAVSPDDPSHFYVAYASGGLWKTENNGITFTPLFDEEMVMTIGDIAVDWTTNTIWLGSGEANSSRSSYAGTGVFKSTDGGKNWTYLGLGESHHIGRIILHPNDPLVAWVAVLGHLYSANEERGVYKTTDGGATWNKTLYVNPNAGAIDLIIDPDDANVLYAASWERTRRAWNFVESGTGSGIYKSTDGGVSWTLLTNGKNGFPAGDGTGRIGLAITKKGGEKILYAAIDNYNRRPKETKEADILTKEELRGMDKEAFLAKKDYLIEEYLKNNGFPDKYSVKKIREMIEKEEITSLALVEYVEDANSLLFDTPVFGLEVYRSTDEGKTWHKTHKDYLDGVYNSYGYYFGQIRVAPYDPDKVYVMGVPVLRSDDGGKTFKSINGDNVHVDHHALWINPNRPGHLILGNDGGINISYDDGENWIKANTPAVNQIYYLATDMAKPYNVYVGLQDNGVWMGPSTYKPNTQWHNSGQYAFKSILGGDGMQIAIDTRDNQTVYTGFQFGNYLRINTNTGERKYITPKHELGEPPLRWNWQAPIHLSIHNQDILYMGANRVYRSFDQGESFAPISPDLTTGGKQGDVAFSTLTAIHESPLKFGLLYTGSDDGLVYVSKDGGNNWINITSGLPKDMWVSRIQASSHVESRVYVVLNGYRWDNFTPMLYQSDDYGATWQQLGHHLPLEPLNVVKEDPENEDILYLGSDHGVYVSLDRGENFMPFSNGIPAVPVHDLVIHPREKELVVGTHGRSIYIADVQQLQAVNQEILASHLKLFPIEKLRYSSRWGRNSWFRDNKPEVKIPVYTKNGGSVKWQVKTSEGLVLQHGEAKLRKGLDFFLYDLSIDEKILTEYNDFLNKETKEDKKPIVVKAADSGKAYLYQGEYEVEIELGKDTAREKLKID